MFRKILPPKPILLLISFLGLAIIGSVLGRHFVVKNKKTEISTTSMPADGATGSITAGTNTSQKDGHLATDSRVVYESKVLDSAKPEANAAVLQWDQQDNAGQTIAAWRIFDGTKWTDWIESSTEGDRKDGTPVPHASLIVAKQIHQIQYRFEVVADGQQRLSPEINLSSAAIELIDTTQGPSPTKQLGTIDRIWHFFGIKKAGAYSGPPIYSRADWGSPEPNSSDRWPPDYRPLERAIVHHTAVEASADSAAAVRAIWHYHANTLGWGDIGYNYLIDGAGNIFQGRYFDHDYAGQNRVDVVGGHALNHNQGSTGVAALGDFTNAQPSGATLNAFGAVIGLKLSRYGVEPSGYSTQGLPAVIGHRDVYQTGCPGNIHQHLPTIRSLATNEYNRYPPYSWSLKSLGIYANAARTQTFTTHTTVPPGGKVYVRLKATNFGTQTWDRSFLRLGTARPYQRTSQFYDASWFSTTRPALMTESSAPPGATATFDFVLTAPSTTGQYQEYFNLVAEDRTWLNDLGTSIIINVVSPVAASNTYNTNLQPGGSLYPQDYLLSPDGQSVLALQNDGNLVLYSNFKAVWSSGTFGKALGRAVLQTDGNFVIYFQDGSNWSTGTFSYPNSTLELQTDGNLVLYDQGDVARWNTVTMHHPNHLGYVNTALYSGLPMGGTIFQRQQLETADRRYRLTFQADGNLVLYSTNRALWSSNTHGRGAKYATMQTDGNLVIYNDRNQALWNTATHGRGHSQLVIQQDGNLVIYPNSGGSSWSSGTFGQF